MKKILILGTFLVFLCLVFPKSVWAQGICTARKNIITQSCELDSNNCQDHYIPSVRDIGAQTTSCQCSCVSNPNNPPPQQPADQDTCSGTCRVGGYCLTGEHTIGTVDCQGFRALCCVPNETPTDGEENQQDQTGGPIQTAIGPIDPGNIQGFIQSLLGIAFGVAGGIAFLLMLFGSFQIMTSSGNPEKMKAGSELITSALTGLLFIIFSIFILKLIGVTILEIPGFGQ